MGEGEGAEGVAMANGYDDGEITTVITVSKLSRLQRFILTAADRNRTSEARADASKGADLYYSEIMADWFGFEPTNDPRGQASQHFDLSTIGKKRYSAASASISRAVLRLQARGLVTCLRGSIARWSGVSLTPQGAKAAKKQKG